LNTLEVSANTEFTTLGGSDSEHESAAPAVKAAIKASPLATSSNEPRAELKVIEAPESAASKLQNRVKKDDWSLNSLKSVSMDSGLENSQMLDSLGSASGLAGSIGSKSTGAVAGETGQTPPILQIDNAKGTEEGIPASELKKRLEAELIHDTISLNNSGKSRPTHSRHGSDGGRASSIKPEVVTAASNLAVANSNNLNRRTSFFGFSISSPFSTSTTEKSGTVNNGMSGGSTPGGESSGRHTWLKDRSKSSAPSSQTTQNTSSHGIQQEIEAILAEIKDDSPSESERNSQISVGGGGDPGSPMSRVAGWTNDPAMSPGGRLPRGNGLPPLPPLQLSSSMPAEKTETLPSPTSAASMKSSWMPGSRRQASDGTGSSSGESSGWSKYTSGKSSKPTTQNATSATTSGGEPSTTAGAATPIDKRLKRTGSVKESILSSGKEKESSSSTQPAPTARSRFGYKIGAKYDSSTPSGGSPKSSSEHASTATSHSVGTSSMPGRSSSSLLSNSSTSHHPPVPPKPAQLHAPPSQGGSAEKLKDDEGHSGGSGVMRVQVSTWKNDDEDGVLVGTIHADR
ncbi:hypothetical protein HDU76_006415, partial [Blyttiomyces sp. JEL0837]